jgi:hypothetical protein
MTPPFTEECSWLADKITRAARDETGKEVPLTQVTINEYIPGQGIAAHIGLLTLMLPTNIERSRCH